MRHELPHLDACRVRVAVAGSVGKAHHMTDQVWRAYSPSRGQALFVTQDQALTYGMASYLNKAHHHPDGGASDWEFHRGNIEWETVDWPAEEGTDASR